MDEKDVLDGSKANNGNDIEADIEKSIENLVNETTKEAQDRYGIKDDELDKIEKNILSDDEDQNLSKAVDVNVIKENIGSDAAKGTSDGTRIISSDVKNGTANDNDTNNRQKKHSDQSTASDDKASSAFVGEGEKPFEHTQGKKNAFEGVKEKYLKSDEYKDMNDVSDDEEPISAEALNRKKKRTARIMGITIAAVAAIVIIVVISLLHNSSFSNLYGTAISKYNSEDYKNALEYFQKAEKTNEGTNNTEVLNYEAKTYIKLEDYENAVSTYNRILQIDPNNGDAVTGICELYKTRSETKKLNTVIQKYVGTNMESYVLPYITASPVFSPESGTYGDTFKLTMTGGGDASIYYTTDGSDPTQSSTVYTKAITISEGTTTVKALSVSTSGIQSKITEAKYVVEFASPAAPSISLDSGNYTYGKSVTITAGTGSTIYYTTDGSTPTANSTKYKGAITLPSGNVILSAVAVNSRGLASDVSTKVYVIEGGASYQTPTTTSPSKTTTSSAATSSTTKSSED